MLDKAWFHGVADCRLHSAHPKTNSGNSSVQPRALNLLESSPSPLYILAESKHVLEIYECQAVNTEMGIGLVLLICVLNTEIHLTRCNTRKSIVSYK